MAQTKSINMKITLSNKQLLNRLIKAYWVCNDCGNQYGKYSVGTSTLHNGRCDVCKQKTAVTEARDYDYLRKGREEYQIQIIKKQKTEKKPTLSNKKRVLRRLTHQIAKFGATHCYTCGNQSTELQAGHFYSDGGHSGTRYDFDNLRPQCVSCNHFKGGNLAVYGYKLIKELGTEKWELLFKRAHEHKNWSREELDKLIVERREILKKLQNEL